MTIMKKIFLLCALAMSMNMSQEAMAQSILSSIFGGMQRKDKTTTTEQQTTDTTTGDVLGSVLGNVLGEVAGSKASGVLGNILGSVTGNATTTQANLIGTWTYTQPAVQFTSQNLLTQAGGAAAATKVEEKLVTYYKMVGITSGRLKFTFDNANNVTYTLGNHTYQGTYVFDTNEKTVTITSANTGMSVKAYVTISGQQMSLCFDSTKVLSLFNAVSQSFNRTMSGVASQFDGMKTGFKFSR